MAEVFLPHDAIERALAQGEKVTIKVGKATYRVDEVWGRFSFRVAAKKVRGQSKRTMRVVNRVPGGVLRD